MELGPDRFEESSLISFLVFFAGCSNIDTDVVLREWIERDSLIEPSFLLEVDCTPSIISSFGTFLLIISITSETSSFFISFDSSIFSVSVVFSSFFGVFLGLSLN